MKKKTIPFNKLGPIFLLAGLACIAASLIFYKEGSSETFWLILFAVGALWTIVFLYVVFFFKRCQKCSALKPARKLIAKDGLFYCPACMESFGQPAHRATDPAGNSF